eukprot:s3835_g4.t1
MAIKIVQSEDQSSRTHLFAPNIAQCRLMHHGRLVTSRWYAAVGRQASTKHLMEELNDAATAAAIGDAWRLFSQLRPLVTAKKRRMLWNTMLKAYANAGEAEKAKDFYDSMVGAQIAPNMKTFGKLMEAAAKKGQVQMARFWMQEMGAAHVGTMAYNQLITAAANAHDLRAAEAVYQEMEQLQVMPNVIAYNSILSAAAKTGDLPACERWYQKMLSRHLEPSSFTFTTLISAGKYAPDGLSWAKRWPCTSLEAYHAFIDVAAEQQDLSAAEAAFQKLKEAFRPTVISYNILMLACCRSNNLRAAQHWRSQMARDAVEPNEVTYKTLLQAACGTSGSAGEVRDLLAEMSIKNLIDLQATNILADAAAADASVAKEWLSMRHLGGSQQQPSWDEVCMGPTRTLEPDVYSFNAKIKAEVASGDLSGAQNTFKQLAREVNPDLSTFGLLIKAFAKVNDHERALQWFQAMNDFRLKPSVLQYTQLLQSLGGEAQSGPSRAARCELILQEMLADHIQPTQITVKVLTQALGRLSAKRLLDDLAVDQRALPPLALAEQQKRKAVDGAQRRAAEHRKRVPSEGQSPATDGGQGGVHKLVVELFLELVVELFVDSPPRVVPWREQGIRENARAGTSSVPPTPSSRQPSEDRGSTLAWQTNPRRRSFVPPSKSATRRNGALRRHRSCKAFPPLDAVERRVKKESPAASLWG